MENTATPGIIVSENGAIYQDPFHPVLLNSPSLHHSDEQDYYIHMILKICCSDSQMAWKAHDAIELVLHNEPDVPVVASAKSMKVDTPTTPAVKK